MKTIQFKQSILRIFLSIFLTLLFVNIYSQSLDYNALNGKSFKKVTKNRRGKVKSEEVLTFKKGPNENTPYVIVGEDFDDIYIRLERKGNDYIIKDTRTIFAENLSGGMSETGEVQTTGAITYPSHLKVGQKLEDNKMTVDVSGVISMHGEANITNRRVTKETFENTPFGKRKCYRIESNVDASIQNISLGNKCVNVNYCPSVAFNVREETTNCKGKILFAKEMQPMVQGNKGGNNDEHRCNWLAVNDSILTTTTAIKFNSCKRFKQKIRNKYIVFGLTSMNYSQKYDVTESTKLMDGSWRISGYIKRWFENKLFNINMKVPYWENMTQKEAKQICSIMDKLYVHELGHVAVYKYFIKGEGYLFEEISATGKTEDEAIESYKEVLENAFKNVDYLATKEGEAYDDITSHGVFQSKGPSHAFPGGEDVNLINFTSGE